MYHIRLFYAYFTQYIKARLAYRGDFMAQVLSDLLFQAVNFLFIVVLFSHTSSIKGWNQYQVMFLYGYFLIPWSIFSAFFNLWDFNDRYIIKGEMDRVLTRPVYSLLQVMMETISPESLIGILTGILLMCYSISFLDLHWGGIDFIFFLLFTIGGVALYAGIYISLTSISLFTDAKTEIQPIVHNIGLYGRYPINLYHRGIQFVLTFVLPFGFVGFYPASYLLHQIKWKGYAFLTPFVGMIYLFLAIWIWNQGIRRYRGSGS
jgi:ABC-2 type transport system permease protein